MVIKFVWNYCFYFVILDLFLCFFYDGEFVVCVDESWNLLFDWDEFLNRKFLIFFIGMEGWDE